MIGIVKNQHIVQRMLLSNFSINPIGNRDKRKIWVYDKNIKKSYVTNLRKVTVEENYLSKEADEIITIIEKECIPAIDNILREECIICKKFDGETINFNNFSIYRYIACQNVRSNKFRQRHIELPAWKEDGLEELIKYQSSWFTHFDPLVSTIDFSMGIMHYNESMKGIEGSKYLIYLDHFPSRVPKKSFDGRAMVLMDVAYPILDINKTKLPFITNDVGLNWYFPLDLYSYSLYTNEGTLDSILTFPLSPKLCIHLCTQKSVVKWIKNSPEGRGLILSTNDQTTINSTNNIILKHANRYIYSNVELFIKNQEIKM